MEYARHAGKVFTAVCNDWQKLLAEDDYKQLVIDALKFRVSRGEVKVGAYVIMPACPFVNVGRLTNILLALLLRRVTRLENSAGMKARFE